jgi:hypothetical protein
MEYDLDKGCTKFPNNLATTSEFLAPETDISSILRMHRLGAKVKRKIVTTTIWRLRIVHPRF